MELGCKSCGEMTQILSQRASYKSKSKPKARNHPYYVNDMGAVYGALLNGGSHMAVNKIGTLAGLAFMNSNKFHRYKNILITCALDAVAEHLEENKKKVFAAYAEEGEHPDEAGILDVEVIYDGTWHTRSVIKKAKQRQLDINL